MTGMISLTLSISEVALLIGILSREILSHEQYHRNGGINGGEAIDLLKNLRSEIRMLAKERQANFP